MNALARQPIAAGTAITFILAVVVWMSTEVWVLRLTELFIWILFAASLNFLVSFSGMVSFGHAAYFGLGAYGFALAAKSGAPLVLAILAGPAVATIAAAAFGLLCVRLTRIYFAMLTLACAEITYSVIHQWYDLTGGDTGLTQFAPPALGLGPQGFGIAVLICCAVGLLVIRRVLDAPLGLVIRSVGENPARAGALGFSPRRVQWIAFVISGCLAGVAGMLYAAFQGNVFPDYAGTRFSLDPLVIVMLGGLGTFAGPIVGAVIERTLTGVLSSFITHWHIVMGVILIGIIIFSPHGFWGLLQRLWKPGERG